MGLCPLSGLRVGFAVIAIPEEMANAIATLNPNHRVSCAVAPACFGKQPS